MVSLARFQLLIQGYESREAHLHDHVTQFLFHLLLGAGEALPQVIADTAAR